jgi:uncharacterized protein YjbI with pentapeptide repeats
VEPRAEECPHEVGWRPDVAAIISTTKVFTASHFDVDYSGGTLCNAKIEEADFSGLQMNGANFSGADLHQVSFAGANLRGANFSRAKLSGINFGPMPEDHPRAAERFKHGPWPGADIAFTNFDRAVFTLAIFEKATALRANFRDVEFFSAHFHGTSLERVKFDRSVFRHSSFNNALLRHTSFVDVLFDDADFGGAMFSGTDLSGTGFFGVNLTNAYYSPASAPHVGKLALIAGVATLTFGAGEESGLILLRNAFKSAGLREREREATYAINRRLTELRTQPSSSLRERAEGWINAILFDWTTKYGMAPGRALELILAIVTAAIVPYWLAARGFGRGRNRTSGLYKVLLPDRIESRPGQVVINKEARLEKIEAAPLHAFRYAAYFSVLSAFHIGWREFNVGSWIARMQPYEFTLRGYGWVRVVSGVQSLLSVYLLAMWALTYFGRPFE